MLQSLLAGLVTKPLDVQIWECTPLVVVDATGEIVYWQNARLEFTPFESGAKFVGHALVLDADKQGSTPEIMIDTRQYVDSPVMLGRRQGIILSGTNPSDQPATWLINGEADRFLTSKDGDWPEFDSETADVEQEALDGAEPQQVNLNSYI